MTRSLFGAKILNFPSPADSIYHFEDAESKSDDPSTSSL